MIRCDGANALVLHTRHLPSLPSPARPLTVSLLARCFIVFGRGLLKRACTFYCLGTCSSLQEHSTAQHSTVRYSAACCTGPSLGPSLGAMEDQIWQGDAAQAHFRKGGFLVLTSITMPIVPCRSAGAGQHDASPHSSTRGRRPAQGKNPHGLLYIVLYARHSTVWSPRPATRNGATRDVGIPRLSRITHAMTPWHMLAEHE